jgi:hypothetical protein
MGTGISLTAVSTHINFEVAVVGILLLGAGTALGDSVMLGYLQQVDPLLTGAWASGTAAAGMVGTLVYLLLFSVLELSNFTVFLILVPTAAIHFAAFLALHYVKSSSRDDDADDTLSLRFDGPDAVIGGDVSQGVCYVPVGGVAASGTEKDHAMSAAAGAGDEAVSEEVGSRSWEGVDMTGGMGGAVEAFVGTDASVQQAGGDHDGQHLLSDELESDGNTRDPLCTRFRRVFGLMGGLAVNMMLVFYFEFMISVGLASLSNPDEDPSNWLSKHSFEVLAVCYQFGALIARSSISVLKIKHLGWITIAQAINWAIWVMHVYFQFLPLYALFPLMFACGILAGLTFVNVFYLLREDQQLGTDKEFAVNIASLSINVGVVSSSISTIIADHTVFSGKHA